MRVLATPVARASAKKKWAMEILLRYGACLVAFGAAA